MSTLAIALKDEIRRLARKEIKAQTESTAKAVAQFRRDIATLKRHTKELEKQISALNSQTDARTIPTGSGDALTDNLRFSARSAKAQRRRTGLSASDYARLVGVSALTIYNWEQGKSRPRKEQFASLASLRGIGKREAQAKLAALDSSESDAPAKSNAVRRKK